MWKLSPPSTALGQVGAPSLHSAPAGRRRSQQVRTTLQACHPRRSASCSGCRCHAGAAEVLILSGLAKGQIGLDMPACDRGHSGSQMHWMPQALNELRAGCHGGAVDCRWCRHATASRRSLPAILGKSRPRGLCGATSTPMSTSQVCVPTKAARNQRGALCFCMAAAVRCTCADTIRVSIPSVCQPDNLGREHRVRSFQCTSTAKTVCSRCSAATLRADCAGSQRTSTWHAERRWSTVPQGRTPPKTRSCS